MNLQYVRATPLPKPFRALAAIAAAVPLLASCGGGGGDAGDTTPAPALSAATTGAPRYGQTLVLTLSGTNLDQALTVSSAGCTSIARSTTAPFVSTASTAYYTCTVNTVGAQQFSVARASNGVTLGSAPYTVPVPQVTMTVNNDAGVSGSFVISLAPQQAPFTVNNFLNYVGSGFYNGSVIHRITTVATAGVEVVQGGGYDAPVAANVGPTHKAVNSPIVLEDNAGLSNVNLTVAMARTNAPDSATSEFFINVANNTNLDRTSTARGYAVFGNVTSGATVVSAMKAAPCVAAVVSACLPIPNLVITSAVQSQ